MSWFRRKPILDAPVPEPEEPEEVEYVEPERSSFDHPYRIRSKELLDEEFARPLDEAAATTALVHRDNTQQVLEGWREEHGGEISWLDGIEAAETWDPSARQDRLDFERRQVQAEVAKQIQTPFIQRMLALQMTAQRWKRKIIK